MAGSQSPLRLLSFDGGGIRGLSSLYVLRTIMQNLEHEKGLPANEHLLPCDCFDLIAGTSTGGLIAIMLGILQMDVQSCIDKYLNLAPKIFPHESFISRGPLGRASKLLLGRPRFHPLPLEREIKRIVNETLKGTRSEDRGVYMRSASVLDKCKVFVCANTEKQVKLTLFRNYYAPWDNSNNCAIWEACRATSAAPTFFPPISIGKPPISYVDGALGHNNPIRSVLDEAKQLWPSRKIACVVSIGTGIPAFVDSGPTLKPLVATMKAITTETEKTASQILQEMENTYGSRQDVYYRFNVPRGLEGVGLHECEKLDTIIVASRDYLNTERSKIQRCVSQILKPTFSSTEYLQFRIPFSLRGTPTIGHFVPRVQELEEIEKCLLQPHNVNRRKVFVLHGLGGIGKTQLALEFARTHKDDFSAIFWLHGENLESLKLSLAEAASWTRKNSKRNLHVSANDDADDVGKLSREALDWLSQRDNNKWLLIYDNCDSLDSEDGGYDLLSMFPEADQGNILVTTRRHHLSSLGTSEKMLGRMNETQSVALLERNIGQEFIIDETSSWDRKWAVLLSNTLDGLPLALVQAARFIGMTRTDIPGYLDHYDSSWADLAENMPDVRDYQYGSIQRTWEISFGQIKRQNLKAANLLQLLACFDCHDIWTDLIMNGRQGSDLPEWFRDVTRSKIDLLATLGTLFDFSLLQKNTKVDSFSMHPVVHQWVAISTKQNLGEFTPLAIVAIGVTVPIDHDSGFLDLQKRLIPHADKVYGFVNGRSLLDIDWQRRQNLDSSEASTLIGAFGQDWTDLHMEHTLRKLGWLYLEQKLFVKAQSVFQFGMDTIQKNNMGEDPLLFRFANCLAIAYIGLDDLDKAESLATTAIQGYQNHFGKNSIWVAKALNCLAEIYYRRDDSKRAIELGEQALSILRGNPEADSKPLSYTLNNLSIFYSQNGHLDKAIEMNMESLNLKLEMLDSNDPDLLNGLENLACRYMDAGSYAESEKLLKQCIQGCQRAFGVKSIEAATEQDFLAHLYWKTGQLAEAEKLYRIAIGIYESALRADHEDTVRCVSNLCMMIFLQWEKEFPFGTNEARAGHAKLPESYLFRTLVELCLLVYKYPGQINCLNYIAKILFRYGKVDQSRGILQGQAVLENGSWSYTDRTCDAVDSTHMLKAGRFVCMVCVDLDLCGDCMATYEGREFEVGSDCFGHPFLDVSIPLGASVDFTEQAREALRKIIEEYSPTEKSTAKVSTVEGFRTQKNHPQERIEQIQRGRIKRGEVRDEDACRIM